MVHLRGHTQEKTYKCNQCSHAFYDSSTLKKHMRTHTGEKPYNCHLCTKKFTQSGNLKRHLLVHKKYEEDCQEKNFADSNKLSVDNHYWTNYSDENTNSQNFNNYEPYNTYNDYYTSNF